MKTTLPRTVLVLGLVSFFTDLSSEMIYPLLPLFLAGVLGAGAAVLGVVEGAAEATASLLKVVSGFWADRIGRRKPLVVAGYGLSGLVRPLVALATAWPFVLAVRLLDRVGKGIRTAPRDALIAAAVPVQHRGAAYGFHRAMDHGGAVVGPLAAAVLMNWAGFSLRAVFATAIVPALVVMALLVWGLHEPAPTGPSARPSPALTAAGVWNPDLRRLLAAVLVFTLGNASDAFILLRLSEVGVSAAGIAGLWSLHHLVKMGATYAGGRLSDRWGRRRLVIAGWLLYAAVYAAMAMVTGAVALIALFIVYAAYYGLTEPCERAWVADLAPAAGRGTAFGLYHAAVGLGALPASLLFGWLWHAHGAAAAFATGAALAAAAAVLLVMAGPRDGMTV